MTPCGWLAAMNSAPTPNATSPMQLLQCNFSHASFPMQLLQCNFSNAASPMQIRNQSILNPRYQARSVSLEGGADSDSISKEINAEDVEALTLCGRLAVIDSATNPNSTSPMHLLQSNFSNATL